MASAERRVRVAVAGANGYAGMTLVHLLARHPGVELVQLTSRSFAGHPYQAVFPLLELEGRFVEEVDPSAVEVVFSCLPHNVGADRAAGWLGAGARVIDMSADFRLRDASLYPIWYRQEHPAPQLLEEAVLGLPELHAAEIRAARLVAVPGCYATASILALAPAVVARLAGPDVVVDAKSGVSGAGRSPGLGTHFAEVGESLHAYAIGGHRHLAELEQELGRLADGSPPRLTFVPHLVPMVRGILVTCYFDLRGSLDALVGTYREFYRGQPFVRVLGQTPATKLASHTNYCLIHVAAQGPKAVVTAAIDNLVKGASGQGVECFNLVFGFDRDEGLRSPVQWP
ncbi:MAG TPA: N-acetyl-gamma-glutamyl-phosphate reductase [Candidatus Dormibacteraeota bacterium]|nr:N-acetyl-gamma-glutamyl-phosphate reductase [Candidatus Dormibacteraeota bacterium]